MKTFLFLLLPLACMLAGCKYDDSKVWAELNAQKAKIESLESLNSNVSSLQSIVAALQKNITVTAIRTTDKGQAVSFSSQVWRQGKGDFFLGCLLMAEVSTPFVCLGKILIQVRGR